MELKSLEAWFVVGSQTLYGEQVLSEVAEHSAQMVEEWNAAAELPVRMVLKPVATGSDAIAQLCRDANAAPNCLGLVCWMHTFSPAKMWIAGLTALQKPLLHLHTQFNRDVPWATIDMDFMNLHQSAHGDREFGFICTRLGKARKVVVGHWQEAEVRNRMAAWMRAAAGLHEMRRLKIARLGDNMRQVAVTEGDKVEAQIRFGVETHGYGVSEWADCVAQVADSEVDRLVSQYDQQYAMAAALRPDGQQRASLRDAARAELGLRAFLQTRDCHAFTDTFEDLPGIKQVPGLAVQRLMADGYGFGAEGDWKTAALVRVLKVMADGLPGGTSFMEDYTYHLSIEGPKVLGAHMLEVCASLADGTPSCEIAPLSIGGKDDPVRLVFTAPAGPAVNVAMVDLGTRFRLLVNEVDAVAAEQDLPNLPVARALWAPRPDLKTAAAAWIYAGGPHHMAFSQALGSEPIEDFAEMAGVECVMIDWKTRVRDVKDALRWNRAFFER